jgi:hypothetical protein
MQHLQTIWIMAVADDRWQLLQPSYIEGYQVHLLQTTALLPIMRKAGTAAVARVATRQTDHLRWLSWQELSEAYVWASPVLFVLEQLALVCPASLLPPWKPYSDHHSHLTKPGGSSSSSS